MQAPTRVSTTTVHDLLFADNCVLNTTTKADMQRNMELLAAGCTIFGLTINMDTTVVMHQPTPGDDYNAPRINFNGAELKNVENFAYLGSTLSRNTRIYNEVTRRISKASQAFSWLQALCGIVTASSYPRNGRCTTPSSSQHSCTERRLGLSMSTKLRG
ncbi:unnamed protein product [Dibothriocephalus latus]|uniref:Reverse transcriptase domain-containing protein n=1 Tax=Dibothriocephalus latus TaxID=60516 RepID=A0A3P7QLX8_DIBLA|nr:unnamed protein product [Dibothriocephalus latus]